MALDFQQNYFELFGLPVDFDVDAEALSLRYRELQRAAHPDRFADRSEQERRMSVQQAAHINEAFRVLKDPLARARYLLELHGVPVEETDTAMEPAFLMEQMELRESLDGVRSAADPFTELDRVRSAIESRERELVGELGQMLAHADSDNLERAREQVKKLQFMRRLIDQSSELEEDLVHQY